MSELFPSGDTSINFDAGTYKINNAYIYNDRGKVDVKNIIKSLNIYENILSPFITGNAFISDTSGYLSALPMIGEEMFLLEIQTPLDSDNPENNPTRIHNLFIYKITNRENASLKNVVFTIHFVSLESFVDMNKKISKTFKGKISDIVNTLLTTDVGIPVYPAKNAIIEETSNSFVYTSNFWTPTQNLYYLCSKAVNKQNIPNYIFFEGYDGYVFMSLDTLYRQDPIMSFKRDQDSRQGTDPENLTVLYSNIMDFSVPDMSDYINRHKQGAYGGSNYHLNLQNKNLEYITKLTTIDYPTIEEDNDEGVTELINNKYGETFNPQGVQFNITEIPDLYNQPIELIKDINLKRLSHLKRMDTFKINIEVLGLVNYSVGTVVSVTMYKDMPISDEMTDDDIIDNLLSGNYLITSINHEFTNNKHLCFMELSKDYF